MTTTSLEHELSLGASLSIINAVDLLIEKANGMRASDIHIDPSLDAVRVRFRVDGVLQDICALPKIIHSEIISRIKILSQLRTDEHQTTQDGRFRHSLQDKKGFIDIRVAIAPTYHGENAVLRLLADHAEHYSLEMLGFSKDDRTKILEAVKKPNGMVLATGPTGSGKTTTLYTLIKMLNSKEISIVTIEDPIEFAVDGIEQIQVNTRTGLTFASGLRSILRQDPDVIMVGEIRDQETAGIAVNAALTGHLLLTTLHTNDATTTLPRLLDMKVESFLVASTVNIAIAQRLVRKICTHCKEKIEVTSTIEKNLAELPVKTSVKAGQSIFKGKGCKECNESGYLGRICINEVLVVDNVMREAILNKISAAQLKEIAIRSGMTTMLEDGLIKVLNGDTTIEEVFRVVHE